MCLTYLAQPINRSPFDEATYLADTFMVNLLDGLVIHIDQYLMFNINL